MPNDIPRPNETEKEKTIPSSTKPEEDSLRMQTQEQLLERRKELPSSRPTPSSDASSSKRAFLAPPGTSQERDTKRRSLSPSSFRDSRSPSPDTRTPGQKAKDTNLDTDSNYFKNLSEKGHEAQKAMKEKDPDYKMLWETGQEARKAKQEEDPDFIKNTMQKARNTLEKKHQIKPEEQTDTLRRALGSKRPAWMTDTPAPSTRPEPSESSSKPPEPSKDTQ